MMSRSRTGTISTALVLLVGLTGLGGLSSAALAEEVLLRLRPTEGARYVMTLDVKQDMIMAAAGSETAMTNNQVMTAGQTVTSVSPDGVATTVQTIERMQLESKMGETVVMSFDSDAESDSEGEPQPAEVGEALGAMTVMIGKPISVTTSPRGEILAVEGLDEIWAAVAGEDPAQRAIVEQIKAMFGEDAMRQQMQMYGVLLPEEPIAKGHSWSHEMDLTNPLFGAMVFDINYSFLGRETRESVDCAVIATVIEGDLDFDMSGLVGMMGGGEFEMDMAVDVATMSGEGELCVEVATGITRHSVMDFAVELAISMTMGEEAMEMGMDLDQHMVMRLDPVLATSAE